MMQRFVSITTDDGVKIDVKRGRASARFGRRVLLAAQCLRLSESVAEANRIFQPSNHFCRAIVRLSSTQHELINLLFFSFACNYISDIASRAQAEPACGEAPSAKLWAFNIVLRTHRLNLN